MSNDAELGSVQQQLEAQWAMPGGFFYQLRQGDYDPNAVAAIEKLISSITIDDDAKPPCRLVSLTWLIPTFMRWQIERVAENGGDVDGLRRTIVRMQNALDELLGVP
jgi:hypothetical protein